MNDGALKTDNSPLKIYVSKVMLGYKADTAIKHQTLANLIFVLTYLSYKV